MIVHKMDEWKPLVINYLTNELGEKKFKKLCEMLQTYKGVIAGGSILKSITKFDSTQNNIGPTNLKNDIDIYVNTKYIPDFLKLITSEIIEVSQNNVFWASIYCVSFLRKNGIRRVYQYESIGGGKFDVMSVRNKKDIKDVVTNFDLTFCQVWFDGINVYATHPEDIKTKNGSLQNDYVSVYKSGNKFLKNRIEKYKTRGFKINIKNENKNDKNIKITANLCQDDNDTNISKSKPYNNINGERMKRWVKSVALKWVLEIRDGVDNKYNKPMLNLPLIKPGGSFTNYRLNQLLTITQNPLHGYRNGSIYTIREDDGYDSEDMDTEHLTEICVKKNKDNNELIYDRTIFNLLINFYMQNKHVTQNLDFGSLINEYPFLLDLWIGKYLEALKVHLLRKGTDYKGDTGLLYYIHEHKKGVTQKTFEKYISTIDDIKNKRSIDKTPCYHDTCKHDITYDEIRAIVSNDFFINLNLLVDRIRKILLKYQLEEKENSDIKKEIKDIDLSTFTKKAIDDIFFILLNNGSVHQKTIGNKLFLFVDNPKGGININVLYKNNTLEKDSLPIFFYIFESPDIINTKYILDKYKPDINKKYKYGATDITILFYLLNKTIIQDKRINYYDKIKILLDNGADVNIPFTSDNISLLQYTIVNKSSIEIIKLLLDSGANKDYKAPIHNITALDMAIESYQTDKEYYGQVIELLGGKIPGEEKWKGFSRSDIEKFDIFFEKPFDWSCCPVCLEYVERSDGCMYMSHDCKTTKHFYHKKLYDTFVYEYYGTQKIEWCTICGRITKNHKHYVLSSIQSLSIKFAPMKPEIQEQLDRGDNLAFFNNANCIGFGGGGTEEKAARFRRMREYALELQDDVDKKKLNEAMEELIEEVWNAPLVRNKKIKKILEDKKWNINVKEFPENKRNTRNNNNNANVNAANVPFNGVKPTVIEDDCIIIREDKDTNTRETNPKYHFHHETIGGIDHEGIYICQKDLVTAIEIKNAEFGLENFTKCWWHYTCKANLHPEELKGIIPDVLYEEYRKKFNKKMKQKGGTRKQKKQKMRGGNVKSMLHELRNGTCDPHNWTRDGKIQKYKTINTINTIRKK